MQIDAQGMRVLDGDACVALLSSARLGRIALTDRAMPIILPVAFACLDRDIIFNVGSGVLARAADSGQIVCFQADWADETLSTMWSVAAIGQLRVVTDPAQIERAIQLDLGPWSKSSGGYVRLTPELISGRSRSTPT